MEKVFFPTPQEAILPFFRRISVKFFVSKSEKKRGNQANRNYRIKIYKRRMQQHQQIRFVLRWWSCVRCQGWMPTLKNIKTKKKKKLLIFVYKVDGEEESNPILTEAVEIGIYFSNAIFVKQTFELSNQGEFM